MRYKRAIAICLIFLLALTGCSSGGNVITDNGGEISSGEGGFLNPEPQKPSGSFTPSNPSNPSNPSRPQRPERG